MNKIGKVKNRAKRPVGIRGVMRRAKRSLMIYNSICLKQHAPVEKIGSER